jgi:hypothetical protein
MATGKKTRPRPADGDFWLLKRQTGSGSCAFAARRRRCARSTAGSSRPWMCRCRKLPKSLPAELREPVWFWRRIVANADQVTLTSSTGISKRAAISEASGLERDGGYSDADLAKRLIAWTEKRDTTMADNERDLREKRWVRGR